MGLLCAVYEQMIAPIQVNPSTREELAALKSSRRETYDELLRNLMMPIPKGDGFRVGWLNARLDLRAGRAVSHGQVKRPLGL